MLNKSSWIITLLVGDILLIALVTLFGFASHGTLGEAGARVLTTFLPLLLAWFLAAPFLGVYHAGNAFDARQLWRPFWAMVLAAPLAAVLRGCWLGQPVLPLFVVILGGISALAVLAWHGGLLLLRKTRMSRSHG